MRQIEEWRTLGIDELRVRLVDAQEELANLSFQLGSHQLENQIQVRISRRNVARLLTLIREKELSINQAPAGTEE